LEVISAEGTRQGDPLAGTFFNLEFLHILLGLIKRHPSVTPFGIHDDDVTLVGPPAEVIAAFEWAIKAIPETTGLAVQPTKTIATCPSGRPVLNAPHQPTAPSSGCRLPEQASRRMTLWRTSSTGRA
jgi:hypothetical protein